MGLIKQDVSFTNFMTQVEMRSNDPLEQASMVQEQLLKTKVLSLIPGWHISDLRKFYQTLANAVGQAINIGGDFREGGAQTGERWLEIKYDHDVDNLAAYRHSRYTQMSPMWQTPLI